MSAPAQAPGFRDYGEGARAAVHELYRLNHTHQTLDFVRAQKRKYLTLDRRRMTVWEALELLETLVDDSDPDIELGQIEHALQTAEAADTERRVRRGELDLVYVAPERLLTPRCLDLLAASRLALIAIDEAHCVSQWGHDFRAEYLQLAVLASRFPGARIKRRNAGRCWSADRPGWLQQRGRCRRARRSCCRAAARSSRSRAAARAAASAAR